jgi:copper transport protein
LNIIAMPPRRIRRAWWLGVAGAGLLAVLLLPAAASAHALLASSSPEPGQVLGSEPGVVSLTFSQPLAARGSQATVTDPAGRRFTGTVQGATILVSLSGNTPGTYRVAWTSVSALDAHVLQGSFEFGVGVASAGRAGESPGSGLARYGVALTVARAVEDTALLLAIGMLVLQGVAAKDPELAWVRPRIGTALLVALVGGIGVVATEALSAASSLSASAVVDYLRNGSDGVARLCRLGAEAAAALAARLGARRVAWVLVVGAGVALAASGHAAAITPAWWGVGIDAGHVVAAGVWAGGILALATLRPPEGWRGDKGLRLLRAFSPAAVAGFLATACLGAFQAFAEVGSLHALVATDYGHVLMVKIALVAAMLPLSALVWRARRVLPRAEALLAVAVIAAAALLGALPAPGSDAVRAPTPAPASSSALPVAGELTMGSHAGSVLVGLSLSPGTPGPNVASVYLLPLTGTQATAALTATFTAGSAQPVPLATCGQSCRRGSVLLTSGESVAVTVTGAEGGTAGFILPSLPAPSGAGVLKAMMARMHTLHSWVDSEVLSNGVSPPDPATYTFEAPDRMEEAGANGAAFVLIGGTSWVRTAAGQPWQVETGAPPPVVPSFSWDDFQPFVDPVLAGQETLGGVPTQGVWFFGSSGGLPAWFELWIDAGGLVRQADMWAQGHVMVDDFSAFDTAPPVEPPAG